MKTKLMISLVVAFYGLLTFLVFLGIKDTIFSETDSNFIIALVVMSAISALFEAFRATIFCATKGKFRAFIMTTLGIFVTTTMFVLVLACIFVLSVEFGILNENNQSTVSIYCVIVAWVLTLVIYTLIFQRFIQPYSIALNFKVGEKVVKNASYIDEIKMMTDEELKAKEKAVQFYTNFSTLIGIGYSWFFIGNKDSILDVVNSSTSMYTMIFVAGTLVYATLRHLPFVNNEYKY